jgi:hypothetical protein
MDRVQVASIEERCCVVIVKSATSVLRPSSKHTEAHDRANYEG